ncbi:capsule biosynthesis protein [Alkanindiges hydrocarboniclasticus]|uniref:Capsule biosynthesis protein n=1 Tax=Alkanindiges hydrocarboniclasticus TaxID=1907941 RepID=A0A1S8CWX0_9GAMM|nr:capsule biosynthesis protein [Alkanindiges hydrocarboniclasticus]ONG41686.1 capsule biosynthesis protein [Alkanindiges hydrocarboniclasticus]
MRLLKNNRIWLIYFSVVLIPLLTISFYLFTLAKDRYVSTSVVIVKQVGQVGIEQTNGLGALLGVNNTSAEDAQFLKAYIQSPDMIYQLNKELNLIDEFKGDGSDPIFQLPANASVETLVNYFNKRVQVNLDEKTMMLKVVTQGFSPEFSLKLNKAILSQSEQFINNVSQRIAKDQLVFAQDQLNEATSQLSMARTRLLNYQNQNQMFDPQTQALAVAQLVTGLESNLAQLRTEERMLLSYLNPDAPQVIAVRSQIIALEQQINLEKSKLTSKSAGNKLNSRAADFEALKAQVEFNTDLYKISLGSLEKARLEAVRKLKNVIVITSPQLAQDAYYPRRGYILLSAFFILTVLFGIGQLIASVIREHQE